MAIKNFIVNNKKKSICILTALIISVVSVLSVVVVKQINAGVFRNDENGNKMPVNEIKILEIVAREGEQVLGYTVEGQEPISVSDIENYKGSMDLDVEDFKNATGYEVTKIANNDGTFSYKVNGSVLNKTFNNNVLGESMSKGEIVVDAVPAADVKISDVEWADLIYINSNDYNSNLLYYYDQFVRGGSMGIEAGNLGQNYNDIYFINQDKLYNSIDKLMRSVGNKKVADTLTLEDFEYTQIKLAAQEEIQANLSNYREYNIESYKQKLTDLDEEMPDSIADGINRINEVLGEANSEEKENAKNQLVKFAGMNLNEDEREANKLLFLKAETENYIELNSDRYFDEVATYTYGMAKSDIQEIVNNVNAKVAIESLEMLLDYKNKANAALANQPAGVNDKYGFTQEDYDNIAYCFKHVNLGKINDGILTKYTESFLDENFEFNSVNDSENIRNLINSVNETKKNEVLEELADAVADENKMNIFCENAESNFEYMDINGYDRYYINNYIENLKKLTDANEFKTNGKCDISKIEKFIKDINENEEVYEDAAVSCDLVWKVASAIYNRAMSEDVALMYNSELLTSKKIGDYTQNLTEIAKANESIVNIDDRVNVDNTNNVYKLLLMLRQIRDSYYSDNLAAKIDVNGVFYPNGQENDAEGINSWDIHTFDAEDGKSDDAEVKYIKYREPEVVGQTYGTDGTKGLAVNYVYKRIYSFTGDQFFGGAKFVSDGISGNMNYIITANSGYSDSATASIITTNLQDDNYIMVSAENNGTFQKTDCLYAYFWNDNNQPYVVDGVEHFEAPGEVKGTNGKYIYYKVCVPKGYNNIIITTENGWTNQTSDYRLPNDYKGKLFYINGKNLVQDTSGRNNYVLAGITNSKLNDTVSFTGSMDMRFWAYNNEIASNNFTASYRLYVDDTVIYSGNAAGFHYLDSAANSGNQPFTMNDTIKIKDSETVIVGDDEIKLYADSGQKKGQLLSLSSSNKLKIELNYVDASGMTHTSMYYYQMVKPAYDIKVTNFIKDGKVEYVNFADLQFTYTNMEYVRYAVDNGAYTDITSNNQVINVGADKNIGDLTKLTIAYKPLGGEEIVITTTLKKSEFTNGEHNYLSLNTATNNSGLTNDALLTTTENSAIVGKSKADVIVYLLRVSLMNVTYPINVLEVEPQANASDLDNAVKAREILEALKVDVPKDLSSQNYKKYVNVTSMSVKEFNTRNDELTATYDLIYFGINTGYQYISPSGKTKGRTKYNDSSMDGLVYTGIGDKYTIQQAYGGLAASDYEWVGESSDNGEYRISSYLNTEYGIDVNGNSSAAGTNIICYKTTQKFKVNKVATYNDEDVVTIERNNGYVGVSKEGLSRDNEINKVNVELKTKNNSNYSKWIRHNNSDGTVTFENYGYRLKTGRAYCLDLNEGNAYNGQNIQIYKSNNSRAQKWYVGTAANGAMDTKMYETWKKYYTTGMTGNSNPTWNLDKLDSTTGYYYMKSTVKSTRIGGCDITVRKMNELLEYLESGYPILLADEIMNCDSDMYDDNNGYGTVADYTANVSRWPYVDHNSKMYNFILQAKALGKDSSGQYTGLDSDGNRVFKDNKNYASLVSVSMMANGSNPEYLPAENKFEGGLRFAFKRVEILAFEFKSGPKQYDTNIQDGNTGNIIVPENKDYSSYDIILGFKDNIKISESQIEGKYIYKMYVDKSGVGKFEDADTIELSPEAELIKDEDGYVTGVKISGEWPANVEGFIPWKVEAVDINNAGLKYTYIGNSAFKRKEVKDVYVLWIRYLGSNNGNNLNFCDAVKKYAKDFAEDYRIHLVSMDLPYFNEYFSKDSSLDSFRDEKDLLFTAQTSKLKVKEVFEYAKSKPNFMSYNMGLNGNADDETDKAKLAQLSEETELDMIVCGFADSYAALDINDMAALKNIEYFVNSGHSLLYSHDSSSFNSSIHRYSTNGDVKHNGRTDWARYETYFLKSLIGQDRYGITCSGDDLPEEYVNARKYLDTDKLEQSDLRGITETWTFLGSYDTGASNRGNRLYVTSPYGNNYTDVSTFATTNYIMQMNKGQITTYPFVLPDTTKSLFKVATTHTQYSELNLEDSEVTVWYALDASSQGNLYYYTKGDGCNNYYIYSKGNVTYTGAGHSLIGDGYGLEQKLFINTLVASIKTGNYAPVVTVNNATVGDGGTKVITRYKDSGISVRFTVSDYDLKDNEENGFSDFRIYIDVNDNGKYDDGDILINNPDNPEDIISTYMRDVKNQTQKINITKADIKNKKSNMFYISNDDLNVLNEKLGGDIYKYNFIVEAVDNGYLKAKDDAYKEATKLKASDKFKLVYLDKPESEEFNLN